MVWFSSVDGPHMDALLTLASVLSGVREVAAWAETHAEQREESSSQIKQPELSPD